MENLLHDARRQQEEILRQRNIEKLRQNEKMREKLLERRKAKVFVWHQHICGIVLVIQ